MISKTILEALELNRKNKYHPGTISCLKKIASYVAEQRREGDDDFRAKVWGFLKELRENRHQYDKAWKNHKERIGGFAADHVQLIWNDKLKTTRRKQ